MKTLKKKTKNTFQKKKQNIKFRCLGNRVKWKFLKNFQSLNSHYQKNEHLNSYEF